MNAKLTRVDVSVVALCLCLLLGRAAGQSPAQDSPKPRFTPAQLAALDALYEHGGIAIQLDEQRPGTPVVLVDFRKHPEFQEAWLKHLLPFSELKTLRLAGTTLTDAGLNELAGCKQLKQLDVTGTRVTAGAVIALSKALPELEITVEPEKLGRDREWLDNRPVVSFADKAAGPVAAEGKLDVKRFTAAEIKQWRERLTEIAVPPEGTPNGWSKSRTEPAKMLEVFPELKVRKGYVLRAYIFSEEANSNGFVWALPADAEFPAPADCPRIESHFLKPPKPFDALDDMMEAIEGDDSLESYLHASILRRELREFGGGWHGIEWGMHTVLDADPWDGPRPAADAPPTERPASAARQWRWQGPRPASWRPEVRRDGERVLVTFHSYTPLMKELDAGKYEKERIVLHTDTYRRNKYRPLVSEKKLADGPDAVAH